MLPLDGVTVVDFTQFLSGPYCTMQLADFGADVIKIERPGSGDDSRKMGPIVNGIGYPWHLPNRNKRSLAVDLKAREGREIVKELVARADIIVENFRPGVAARLGFGFEEIHAQHPELIYCSISGFGQTGPISQRAGFDIIAQGMGGFLRMTGHPGGEPAKFGIAVNDLAAGLTAANAILAAYIRRLREGGGQHIDVSLLDSGIALTVWEAGALFGDGTDATPQGSRHRGNAPYQAFRTSDGYVTVGANNDRLWERLCADVLQAPQLLEREEYRTPLGRITRVDELEKELTVLFEQHPTDYWVSRMDASGVPGGPVLTYADAMKQEQVAARNMIVDVEHPVLGTMQVLGPAAKMSQTPPTVRFAAPLIGQHTGEIMRSLGYGDADIAALHERGVLESPPSPAPMEESL